MYSLQYSKKVDFISTCEVQMGCSSSSFIQPGGRETNGTIEQDNSK